MKISKEHLIKGTFDTEEAISIVSAVFVSKIQYHSIGAHSHEERKAEKPVYHLKRIEELMASRANLMQVIRAEKEKDFVIECVVKLKSQEKKANKKK